MYICTFVYAHVSLDINPSFHSLVTPEMKRREQLIQSTEEYCDIHREANEQQKKEETLFSSLPTSLTSTNKTVEEEREGQTRIESGDREEEVKRKQDNHLSNNLSLSLLPSSSMTTQVSVDPPSFINRFKNLNEQEKELVDKEREDFVVSRQKKTKKKKKRKKKEESSEETSNLTTPTANDKSLDSIKENKPPTYSDEFLESDEHVLSPLGDVERDHVICKEGREDVAIPDLHEFIKTEQSPVLEREIKKDKRKEEEKEEQVTISTNPFGEDSDPEQPLHHMTSSHDFMTSSLDHMKSNDNHMTSSPNDHVTSTTNEEAEFERRGRSDAVSSIDDSLPTTTPTMTTPTSDDTVPNLSLTSPIIGI